MKALDVAKYIINHSIYREEYITNLKLNFIMYEAQKEYLQLEHRPLIDEEFVAWNFGPCIKEVYGAYCMYGAMPITSIESMPEIDYRDLYILDSLLEVFLPRSVRELHNMVTEGAYKKIYTPMSGNDCWSHAKPIPNTCILIWG